MLQNNVVNMNESILMGVREACNVSPEDDGFDKKIIPLINSFMMIAHHRLGVGFNGFRINGATEVWRDWLGDAESKLEAAKTWLGLKVFMAFDPPDNGSMSKAYEETINDMEWTLCSKSGLEGHAATLYPVEFDDD